MFLKKFLCVNNVVSNRKQFKQLLKVVQSDPSVHFKPYSCPAPGADTETTMTVNSKSGTKDTTYEVKNVIGSQVCMGKSPFWHKESESLYYADVCSGKILRFDNKSKEVKQCQITGSDSAAFIIPVRGEDNQFVVGSKRNIELVIWDGCSDKCCVSKTLAKVQDCDKYEKNRFNTGKTDPEGRLFAGTMADDGNGFEQKLGELFFFDGTEAKSVAPDLGMPSGVAINKEGTKLYLVDSADYSVKEYSYCKSNGSISSPKVIYNWAKTKIPQFLTVPEGLTLDSEGMVYVGTNSGTIYKIDPCTGNACMIIYLPVKQITDLTFGGDKLFVTTGAKFDEPLPAGQLFTITGLGAKGCPPAAFRLKSNNCS